MDFNFSINTILCLLTALISVLAFSNDELRTKLLHIPYLENNRNEKFRLLSSGLIHADVTHLAFNMIALYSFGENVENWFKSEAMFGDMGSTIYILMYVVAIVAANLPTFYKHKNNPNYMALGASGAVSAVIFAEIINNPTSSIYLYLAIPIKSFIFGILYLAYENYASKKMNDNIGHDAHFYGAVFGILFVGVLKPHALVECFEQISRWVQSF
jgi:membrane associated rhomboid family serine protease